MKNRIGILTVSDRAAAGQYQDKSGPLIAGIIEKRTDWIVTYQEITQDDLQQIVDTLLKWTEEGLNLILTTGGTGFSPRDVTPEATLKILEKQTPGIVEALRAESLRITKHAMLSRAVAGIRASTLIINLPGNPKAVKENMDVLMPVLPHALELLQEQPTSEQGHRSI